MLLKYILVFLVLLLFRSVFSQKLTYDIFLFGNKIGETEIEKLEKNDSITQYTLNSLSEAHVFFVKRRISLHYDITYKRDKLFWSYSKHTRNDEVHFTTIAWQNNKYVVKRDNETFTINDLVDCSSVKLFFTEPCSPTTTFSERLAEPRKLKKTGEGVYQADMSDGLTYFYRYKSGKLIELEMKKGILGSIYLRPKT